MNINNSSIAFTKVDFKNISLPTRLVRSATEFFISPDGFVMEKEIDIFNKLSNTCLGLVISSHTCVSPEGRSNNGQNALWDDKFISGEEMLTNPFKNKEIKIIAQLGHGGSKADGFNNGLKVCTPDNMSENDIKNVIKAFGKAALRAKHAGFNGIQIHGAHHYLLSQMFYPEYNHRTDKYGGNAENRFRIIYDIALEIKKVCGDNYPVMLKINSDDKNNSKEYFNDICTAMKYALNSGIEAVEISGYNSTQNVDYPYFFKNALNIKENTDIPIMLVGGIKTKEDIESILNTGIKTVSFSRTLMGNVQYLNELYNDSI